MSTGRLVLAILAGVAIVVAVNSLLSPTAAILTLFVLGAVFTWLGRRNPDDD